MLSKTFKNILLIILVFPLIIFTSACDHNQFDNKKFDQKAWLENSFSKGKDKNLRFYMSADVLKNHLKIGMTRKQVNQLLGKPDSVDSQCLDQNPCDNYYLGEYNLSISFDQTGKLIKKDIVSI
ncbi:MAG TPA: hypothetical protein VK203_06670 [Nostocaceae cyanobacterium]|nr:hypothetical protein [Nostocaceae cyanobacterium]